LYNIGAMKERTVGNTVMIIDGGGRGSALVDAYTRSPRVGGVLAVPGNDLMSESANGKPVQTFPKVKTTDKDKIVKIARRFNAALVDVAQDNAIEAGVVNALEDAQIPVVGPTREAGQIEHDKTWARQFGKDYGLPQPKFNIFNSEKEALRFLDKQKKSRRWYIKAAGLAEGKGALPAQSSGQARSRVRELRQRYPEAASTFLIEEWLKGEEFSLFVFTDGVHFKTIGAAKDYKKAQEKDRGENTGGMGSLAPHPSFNEQLMDEINSRIIEPTINGLFVEKNPYKGVLYLGEYLSRASRTLLNLMRAGEILKHKLFCQG
jgi:phosphoribosylamine--glycine ligase